MGKKDKRVDAYIAGSAEFARPILTYLRDMVHQGCPDAEEKIKWGFPNFEYHGLMCNMASFSKHCAFGFWKAKLLTDSGKYLTAKGESAMGNFGTLRSVKDLPPRNVLLSLIKEAASLNEQGIKPERKPKATERKPLVIPTYFSAALGKKREAEVAFAGFTYSQQKDYLEWVTEAKTEETRNKRLTTAIEWISEGKGRNWKYERK